MPCRSDYELAGSRCKECPELKRRLDRTTQLLCYMVGEAKLRHQVLPNALINWSEAHDAFDEVRLRQGIREAVRKGRSVKVIVDELTNVARAEHPLSEYHINVFERIAKECTAELKKEQKDAGRKEQAKKAAIEKLTREERDLLGL